MGFSGGIDSTALLHALYRVRDRLGAPLKAIHFHHGLHPEADAWSRHCHEFCSQRRITLVTRSLEMAALKPSNVEETGRNLRYRALAEILDRDEVYLTAHHADDQAETVFLNLMRGSGPEGLAGIPELRQLGKGWVARPLLNWSRSDLVDYAQCNDLKWMEDPSNRDESFDRNFLRNRLFPLIESRWPEISKRLNRSARIAKIASEALSYFIGSSTNGLLGHSCRMPIGPLLKHELALQTLIVRQWLRQQEIPPPPEARLLEFLDQLSVAGNDSQAEVCWRDWRMKHFQGSIWLQDISTPLVCQRFSWTDELSMNLGTKLGSLQVTGAVDHVPDGWMVDRRKEGGRIQLEARTPRRTLKECFRLAGIPPWIREAIPILYWDEEVAAIGDWMLSGRLQDWLESNNASFHWNPVDSMLLYIREICHQ